jgi:hypothetical protein
MTSSRRDIKMLRKPHPYPDAFWVLWQALLMTGFLGLTACSLLTRRTGQGVRPTTPRQQAISGHRATSNITASEDSYHLVRTHSIRNVRLSEHGRAVTLKLVEHLGHPQPYYPGVDHIDVFIYEAGTSGTPPRLLHQTRWDEPCHIVDARVIVYRASGQRLLAIQENGGQHDHTQIFYLQPRPLRLLALLDKPVIYADADKLSDGILIEHCPDQYVWQKPAGFHRRNASIAEYLTRKWTYQAKRKRFVPASYEIEPLSDGG